MLWEGRRILECRSRGDLARSGSGSSGSTRSRSDRLRALKVVRNDGGREKVLPALSSIRPWEKHQDLGC